MSQSYNMSESQGLLSIAMILFFVVKDMASIWCILKYLANFNTRISWKWIKFFLNHLVLKLFDCIVQYIQPYWNNVNSNRNLKWKQRNMLNTVRFNCQRRQVNFPPRLLPKMPKITSQRTLSLFEINSHITPHKRKMGLGGRPEAPRATGSTQKACLFGVQS